MKHAPGATSRAGGAWLTSNDVPPLHPGDPGEGGGDDHDPVLDQGVDEDDVDGGDVGFRSPLPPEDRVWRHPSEVARSQVEAAQRARARRNAGAALVSGALAAVVAAAALLVLGADDEGTDRAAVATTTARAERPTGAAAGATRSVAEVVAQTDGATVSGSGVVWREDGLLVTDAGLVGAAERVHVVLPDGSALDAEVVGTDELTGIAVVRVAADGLAVARLGRADALGAGDPLALVAAWPDGDPAEPVAAGVVAVPSARVEGADGAQRYGMIVVASPFPDGAVGGALVDRAGAVVGIATGVQPGGGGAHGVATPVELVRRVADQIVEHGRARHVWLGLHGRDQVGGAHVDDLVVDGPADRAGVRAGDVIVAVDGEPTTSMAALIMALRLRLPGDVVVVELQRDGERRQVRIDLAERDDR